MKIAVSSGEDFLCQKYCLCKDFIILSKGTTSGEIVRETHDAPPSEIPGIVAKWLLEYKVDTVIGRDIATLTKDCFEVYGIKVISISKDKDPEAAALKILKN